MNIIGRSRELEQLTVHLGAAVDGDGRTILISGEPGIGKTRIIEELRERAGSDDVKVLCGAAASDTVHPFLMFSNAMESELGKPLFHEQEYKSFAEIFAVNSSGQLMAKASSEEGDVDAGIFAGMLSAVQDFVRDSFDSSGDMKAGLGRLEYGDMKILIEHGRDIFLTAVFKGTEHQDMRKALKRAVRELEERHGDVLRSWDGSADEVAAIRDEISKLAGSRYLVRRELEGLNLHEERVRIASRVLDFLISLAVKKPVLLILEDLHWADESSLFVLSYLARNMRKHRICLLGTLRPGESRPLAETLDGMKKEGTFSELALERLGGDSVSDFIHQLYSPNDFPPELVQRLAGQCEGNPFFVTEMLRQMSVEGCIERHNGMFTLVRDDYLVPDTVEDVVYRRLDSFEPDAISMAEYSSCIGRRFLTDVALSAPSIRDSEAALQKVEVGNVILRQNGTAEFTHAIFQDVIYRDIGERWKVAHHKSIGEYYEAVYTGREDEVLYELARHFSRSNEHQKGFDYCRKAGERAESAYAPEQALEFYEAALTALSHLRDADPRMKNELLERLADVAEFAARYDLALGYLDRVTYTEPVDRSRCLGKRAGILHKQGNFEESITCAAEAAGVAPPDSAERIKARFSEVSSRLRTGTYAEARALMDEALATPGIDAELRGLGLHQLGNVAWYEHELERARDLYLEAYEVRRETEDRRGLAKTIANLGIIYRDLGDLDSADKYSIQALEMHEKMGDRHGVGALLADRGNLAHMRGDIDAAIDFQKRSLVIREEIGDRWGAGYALLNIGSAYYDSGRPELALGFQERALDVLKSIGDTRGAGMASTYLGYALKQLGQHERAIANLETGLKILEEVDEREGWGLALYGLAEARLEAGDPEGAMPYCERLAEVAAINDARGQALMMRGRIKAAMGEDWREDMEKGVAMFDTDMTLKAEALYHHATLMAPADPEAARKAIKEARLTIDQYHNQLWKERMKEFEAGLPHG